jgi:hypothetical protein
VITLQSAADHSCTHLLVAGDAISCDARRMAMCLGSCGSVRVQHCPIHFLWFWHLQHWRSYVQVRGGHRPPRLCIFSEGNFFRDLNEKKIEPFAPPNFAYYLFCPPQNSGLAPPLICNLWCI